MVFTAYAHRKTVSISLIGSEEIVKYFRDDCTSALSSCLRAHSFRNSRLLVSLHDCFP